MRPIFRIALLLLLLAPATASAHSDLRLGPFAGGILHPIETLPHLLILIALGLLLGRRPPFRLWAILGIFAPAAAFAMLLTLGEHAPVPALLPTVLVFALGILLANGKATPLRMDLALLASAAIIIGLDSGFTNPSALVVAKVLLGNWVCLLVIVGYVAFYSSLLAPRPWSRSAFRVAGSWIVAISILLLVLTLR